MLTYRVTVVALQFGEDECREDRRNTEHQESAVNAVNHLRRSRMKAVRYEKRGCQRRGVNPKLTDICCIVLAMELALLVCSSVTSAYTSVFILVYCSELKNP